MQSWKNRMNWPMLTLLLVVACFMGYQTSGSRMENSDEPQVIAFVDLENVFQSLTIWVQEMSRLEEMRVGLEEQSNQMRDEVEQMQDDLKNVYIEGTPEFDQALERASLLALEYQGFVEVAGRKLILEEELALRSIYSDIKTAIGVLSEERGIQAVFVDDSRVALPEDPMGREELTRQISARRALYTAPGVDLTQDLIVRMNSDHLQELGEELNLGEDLN